MALLRITWQDSAWIPHLNNANILDYFCQKSNPFYDNSCNNEIARMQRLTPEQTAQMTVRPITDYYIIAGIVHEAPDLTSLVQTRVLNAASHLSSALNECNPEQFSKTQKALVKNEEATRFQGRVQRLMNIMHFEQMKKTQPQ